MNFKSAFFDIAIRCIDTPFKRGVISGLTIAAVVVFVAVCAPMLNKSTDTKVIPSPVQPGASSAMHPESPTDTNDPLFQSGYSAGLSGQQNQVNPSSSSESDKKYINGYRMGQRDRLLTQRNA